MCALAGVPIFIALFSYFGAPFLGESSAIPVFVWLVIFVLAIASGLRGLLSVLPQKLLLRAAIGLAYVAATIRLRRLTHAHAANQFPELHRRGSLQYACCLRRA